MRDRREGDGWYLNFVKENWANQTGGLVWPWTVHWLSSSGPVSVSMLLLSVSEANVCSVDMDEMSLADEDWEAEPDTTSDARQNNGEIHRIQSSGYF